MNISRAIAVQSLTVCAGLILVAAVTVHSWGRYEQAQADAGLNSRTVQDFRLLERATKSWLLNNDLVFASNQVFLIYNTRQQGQLILDEAESIEQTPLGQQASMALRTMAGLVLENRDALDKLQYVTPDEPATPVVDPLEAWDERSMQMAENLKLAGEQIRGAAEQRAALLVGERNTLIKLCVITYLLFAFLVIALWRWLTHSLAKPLSDLTELAEAALTDRQSLDLQAVGPTEVRKLTHSINAFIHGREAQAFERATELEEQKQKLESEVGKRIAAEQVAQEAAEIARAASKAKSQFLANMSHEIRTPLNGIIGSAELLMQDSSPAKTGWGLNNIQKSSHHLLSLVNDVLDFSKIEAGELELDPHAFLLDDLLMELRSIFSARAREKNLLFVYEIAPDVPARIEADSLRIRQVLTNLLGNAFNYTESGYVVLRCFYREGHAGDSALTFEVQDSGIGIPAEKQERIFESFRQADSGTTREYGGTGLGLTISKQLTELMGGTLEVESEPGEGSLFRCSVKVAIPDEQPQAAAPPDSHVIIAMDNVNAQRIIGRMLDCWGVDHECASIVEAAERLEDLALESKTKTVVMMDYRDLADGDKLLHRCRQHDLCRIVFGNMEDIDLTMVDASSREAILSYTLVPSELLSTLQSLDDPDSAETSAATEAAQLHGHVLLAEDNPVNQEVARAMLEFLGMQVTIAADGQIAVELMQSEAPDLILMDWHMPNLDGVAATRRIRELERSEGLDETPIVMFTADTQKDSLDICMQAGVNEFLAKPVQMESLRSTLEQFSATTKV